MKQENYPQTLRVNPVGVQFSSDKVKVKMTTPQYRSYGADTQRGDRTDLTAIVTATPQVLRHSQTWLGQA